MNEDIIQSVDVLRKGGIILYPTDTIWGIGCDATNPEAVDRVYKLKKRSDSKSMLVLLGNENLLQQYVKEIPDITWELRDMIPILIRNSITTADSDCCSGLAGDRLTIYP